MAITSKNVSMKKGREKENYEASEEKLNSKKRLSQQS